MEETLGFRALGRFLGRVVCLISHGLRVVVAFAEGHQMVAVPFFDAEVFGHDFYGLVGGLFAGLFGLVCYLIGRFFDIKGAGFYFTSCGQLADERGVYLRCVSMRALSVGGIGRTVNMSAYSICPGLAPASMMRREIMRAEKRTHTAKSGSLFNRVRIIESIMVAEMRSGIRRLYSVRICCCPGGAENGIYATLQEDKGMIANNGYML